MQGLHSFHLASGGLLMSFSGSRGYQTVTFSGMKNASSSSEQLPFLGGSGSAEELKGIVLCIPRGGTRTCPEAALGFHGYSSPLCIPSLP